ncbi:MAG: prolyl oligopeptidase family serine peptidase [Planctomycetes bacterium]|nr:prolyl oligopeptidase family serine peptidase [Planctomycetota bacterium]
MPVVSSDMTFPDKQVRVANCLLHIAWLASAALAAGEDPQPNGLSFGLATDGSLTAWYVSPPQTGTLATVAAPPDGAGSGSSAAPAGWSRHVSPAKFVNLRGCLGKSRRGYLWAYARVNGGDGGRRRMATLSYCAVKAFVDGRLVLDKPEPGAPQADGKDAEFELPAGESTVAVAVQVRFGYCGFQLALVRGDADKPHPTDRLVLREPGGAAPDRAAVFAEALTFEPQRWLTSEGQPLECVIGLQGGWPLGVGTLAPTLRAPEHGETQGTLPPRAPDELERQPWSAKLKLAERPSATFDLNLELRDGEALVASKTVRLYGLHGLLETAQKLETQVRAERKNAGHAFPYTELALEKLQIWFAKLARGEIRDLGVQKDLGADLLRLTEDAARSLDLEAKGTDPNAGRLGYFERCFSSKIDDSPQPYFVHVPSAAQDALGQKEPAKRFPLVLFLHGYVPDYHKHRWWNETPEFNKLFEAAGAFLAIPFGRSNTDFLGPGEVDVLEVLEEMKRLYPIDPDRVYLYGYSMGGMAVYSLGGHFPDLWAGGIAIAGRADSPLLMGTQGLGRLHPFKQHLIRADQPIDLCENFVNIPLRIYHGKQDQFISPDEARRMCTRLREIGCDAEVTVEDGDHYYGFDLMCTEAPLKWLLAQKRPATPKVKKLKNFSPRFGGDTYPYFFQGRTFETPFTAPHEFRINHTTGALEPFYVEREYDGQQYVIKKLAGPIADLLTWNLGLKTPGLPWEAGTFTHEVPLGDLEEKGLNPQHAALKDWEGMRKSRAWNPDWKHPARCGPVKEALCRPFLAVFGTAAGDKRGEELRKQAAQFAQDWYAFAKGRATVKPDREVTEVEWKTKNLILFGQANENLLHGRCAETGKLPFVVKNGTVVAGQRNLKLEGKGILYTFPNPLEGASPESSIVIAAGEPYGAQLPENHKWDLVPDFIVYLPEKDHDGTGTNKPLLAGFFDGKWKWNDATSWWFEGNLPPPPAPEEKP